MKKLALLVTLLILTACTGIHSDTQEIDNPPTAEPTSKTSPQNLNATSTPKSPVVPTKSPGQLSAYLELDNQLGRGLIRQMSFSPDGSVLVVLSMDGIWMLDRNTNEVLYSLQGGDPTTFFAYGNYGDILWSLDGTSLAIANNKEGFWIWSINDWSLYTEGPHLDVGDEIKGSSWSPDGSQLLLETKEWFYLWDKSSNSWSRWIEKEEEDIYTNRYSYFGSLKWREDGKIVHVRDHDLIDIETGEKVGYVPHWIDGIGRLIWGPNDNYIYELFDLGGALIDVKSEERVYGCCNEFAWSPDGRYIALINRWVGQFLEDKQRRDIVVVVVIDTTSNEVVEEYQISEPVYAVVWDERNQLFASGILGVETVLFEISSNHVELDLSFYDNYKLSLYDGFPIIYTYNDQELAIWDSESLGKKRVFDLPEGYFSIQRSYDGDPDLITVIDTSGVLHAWQIGAANVEFELNGSFPQAAHFLGIDNNKMAYSVFTGNNEAIIQKWDIETATLLFEKIINDKFGSIRLSRDRKSLLLSSSDYLAQIESEDFEQSEPTKYWWKDDNKTIIQNYIFSPSGEYIAIKTPNSISIWDFSENHKIHDLDLQDGFSRKIIWTADEKHMLLYGRSDTDRTSELLFWDIEGDQIVCSNFFSEEIMNAAISPDGRQVAVEYFIGLLSIYNTQTCSASESVKASDQFLYIIEWSEDGKRIFTNNLDGTVKIWKVIKD